MTDPNVNEEMRTSIAWFRGSILPYSSLWYTLHRYAVLNRPSSKEIATEFRQNRSRSIDLFRNNAPNYWLNAEDVARLLGEPASALQLGTTLEASYWAADLFLPEMQVCLECLSAGYHSVVMSMRFLVSCPVHGTLLTDACRCGRKFDTDLWVLSNSPGCCTNCGWRFLNRPSARVPTAGVEQILPWLLIGQWLSKMNSSICSGDRSCERSRLRATILQPYVSKWAELLGVSVPDFLRATDSKVIDGLLQTVSQSGPRCRLGKGGGSPSPNDYASLAVYRSIARHVRRRLLGRKGRLCRRLMGASRDVAFILGRMKNSEAGQLAFTSLLWEMHVEARASQASRKLSKEDLSERLARAAKVRPTRRNSTIGDIHASSRGCWLHPYVSRLAVKPFDDWVEMHAAEAALSTLWVLIARKVTEMNETGVLVDFAGSDLVQAATHFQWGISYSRSGAPGKPSEPHMTFMTVRPSMPGMWTAHARR